MKKIFSFWRVILYMTLMPSTLLASTKIDGIYYNFSGNEAIVTYLYRYNDSYSNKNAYTGDVVIPDSVIYKGNTYCVTSINEYAFYSCSSLTSITIPNSVTSIGSNAFSFCTGLTSITIPNSVTSISSNAFRGCTGLTSVTIPNSVTSIGSSTFSGCWRLTSINIPSSVTNIGSSAFSGCTGLTSVNIPNSVTSIGNDAFSGPNLLSVTIGSGVLSIGNNAFSKPIKVIWLPNTPPSNYQSMGGVINYVANNQYTSLNSTTKSVYPFLSSMFEVNGVKYVPVSPSERTCDAIDCAYNESAEKINIGETVTNKGVTLTVKHVNPYLCYGNEFVSEVVINYQGDIGNYAFLGCKKLNKAKISNQGSIGSSAFAGCSAMQTVELGQEISSIGESAFSSCSKLEGIVIPDAVNTLGYKCFENCYSMANVKIGNGVNNILSYAFSGCSALPTIQIPQSVGRIGNYVFDGCTSLKAVLMDDGETELNLGSNGRDPLLASCPLDSVYIGRNINYPTASDKGYSPFYCNTKLRSVTITDKETEVTANEFSGCSALQTIQLGSGISSIGESAFSSCSKLEGIEIPDAVNALGCNCFENCSSMKSVKIGSGVNNIPSYAFSGCSALPVIQIPQSVATIGDYVFNGCASLKAVLMDNGETELNLGSNGSSPLFDSCPLDSVYIGRNINYPTDSSKGYSPFYRNTKLRSVTITDKETEISTNEFYGCTNLKNVRIGDGVTTFGNWAFSGCSSLDYFAFGSSVERIGKEAFSDCSAMTKLISRAATPPVCDTQALDDINKWECTLFVPDGSLASYHEANQWEEFFFMDVDPDGIKEIKDDKLKKRNDSSWYNLSGHKLAKPQKGINILRYSDGTTIKVKW